MSLIQIKRARPSMGTLLHIEASHSDRVALEHALALAFAAVEQVDRLMSFHDPGSELSRLNQEATHAAQSVHPWTFAVLRRAKKVSEASQGLFDITMAPLLVRSGLLPATHGALPDPGRWRQLKLMQGAQVFFEQPMLLDLGGIAKGFAVDVAIHALHAAGCTHGAVNAGGDLRRFGPQPEVIHLRRAQGLVPIAQLRCGAIATSSSQEHYPDRLGQPLGCIMDPRQLKPWRGGSVMVAARACIMADALTKVAALAGPASLSILTRFGAQARWEEN